MNLIVFHPKKNQVKMVVGVERSEINLFQEEPGINKNEYYPEIKIKINKRPFMNNFILFYRIHTHFYINLIFIKDRMNCLSPQIFPIIHIVKELQLDALYTFRVFFKVIQTCMKCSKAGENPHLKRLSSPPNFIFLFVSLLNPRKDQL